ncbi:M56 family metallopeptidase [Planotetraspora phitsanulokensis]|uniref:Integral membrane protein n=1 Tax=Planotetraspora phitsanulokensis TaxID=575192 RepID=A0A8J3U7Z0_9ACTN|nr:M56 family metallopeptidase [Planotetraspora phitsanulokensis]GII39731.1 integral membrane protein [Planotetraspora phitsanulokensis]
MIAAAVLAALATICALAAWRLTSARWTWRAPRTAILLWQSLGVTWGLASTGALLAYALEPYRRGVVHGLAALLTTLEYGVAEPHDVVRLGSLAAGLALLAVLVVVLLAAGTQTLRARHRHRVLLSLIARDEPAVPGVRVVDFPGAAAYCLPGLKKSHVVISDGTLSLLSPDELDAVLAHEAAHVRERHDLVLLPFAALRRALPWSAVVRDAHASVSLLIEMAADDRALRHCYPKPLATALLRFGSASSLPTPQGALGASAVSNVMARVNRLVNPAVELPAHTRYLILFGSALLTASAPLLWLIPG